MTGARLIPSTSEYVTHEVETVVKALLRSTVEEEERIV